MFKIISVKTGKQAEELTKQITYVLECDLYFGDKLSRANLPYLIIFVF